MSLTVKAIIKALSVTWRLNRYIIRITLHTQNKGEKRDSVPVVAGRTCLVQNDAISDNSEETDKKSDQGSAAPATPADPVDVNKGEFDDRPLKKRRFAVERLERLKRKHDNFYVSDRESDSDLEIDYVKTIC